MTRAWQPTQPSGLRVLHLPSGKDPDEFLQDHGPGEYRALLDQAPLWLDWQIDQVLQGLDLRKADHFQTAVSGLVQLLGNKWNRLGSLLVGVSGSWLGGCLFWGWLRMHPALHLPVEAVALPVAFIGLSTKWRIGAGFYLACLLGTAFTDLSMLLTSTFRT